MMQVVGLVSGLLLLTFMAFILITWASASFISELRIPRSHIPFFRQTESFRERCRGDKRCEKHLRDSSKCWGYEGNCSFEDSFSYDKIKCENKNERSIKTFWEEGDFGKFKSVLSSIQPICKSTRQDGSSLNCSSHLRFCQGKNLFINLRHLKAQNSLRYRNDVIHKGDFGGNCEVFNKNLLESMADEKSYLQSWGHELSFFTPYKGFKLDRKHCDVIFERPTVLIKLDAAVNMYHHFCDFVNLYATLHVNGSFDMNINILWWDTFRNGFIDPFFGITWRAFSKHRSIELISLDGKRVCFRSVVLSLLARQRLGLYYNMPLIKGCSNSGLFEAFSEFVLHRIGIKQNGPLLDKVRITLLSRSTRYRRIINEDEVGYTLEVTV
uniref:Uncharacterized protein n=1 Tax=Syphacia muris TaxID=451379 RepID=A0A0N5ALH8_9BILA